MFLWDVWLPVVLSAVGVFVASFLAWVILPHHKPEYRGLGDREKQMRELMGATPPGQYMFPYCDDPAKLKDPALKADYMAGPHGWVTRWPGPPSMGANMARSFMVYLLAALLVGYVAVHAVPAGTRFVEVFRMTFTVGVACFCIGQLPGSIWFGKPGRAIVTETLDGVGYASVMGLIFAALWPSA